VVSHVIQHFLGIVVALRVRWSHICWKETKDIPERHLVVVHLILPLLDSESCQVLVSPSMAGDLVAGRMHSLKELWVAC
jgi:hypothetical protein